MPFPQNPPRRSHFVWFTRRRGQHPGTGRVGETNEMLAKRDRAVWVETIVTTGEQEGTVAAHERFGLDMNGHFPRLANSRFLFANRDGVHTGVQTLFIQVFRHRSDTVYSVRARTSTGTHNSNLHKIQIVVFEFACLIICLIICLHGLSERLSERTTVCTTV